MTVPSATVVLVHGAWHGAWCWNRVLPLLAGEGVPAVALDLPGDPALVPGDLAADVAAVRRLLDNLDGPALLCGHSYGGCVITEAGTHPAVRHLVYISAFVPDTGESVRDVGRPPDEKTRLSAHLDEDGLIRLDPAGVAAVYSGCDPADVEWAAARLRPQRPQGFAQPVTAAAWRSVPATYAVCTADRAIDPELQRRMAARACPEVIEWPAGHFPLISHPDVVAGLLTRLSREAGSGGSRPAAAS